MKEPFYPKLLVSAVALASIASTCGLGAALCIAPDNQAGIQKNSFKPRYVSEASSSPKDAPGMDMSGMDMPGMDMSGMDMPGMKRQDGSSKVNDMRRPDDASKNDMPEVKRGDPPNQDGDTPKLRGLTPQKSDTTSGDSADPTPVQTRKEIRLEFNVFGEPGDTQPPLSLDDLQNLATQNNPTLIQARAQVEGELGKAKQAGLYMNPSLAYNGDLLGLPTAGAGEWQGGMAQQEIILGGKLKLSRQKYLARADAARQQLQAQTLRVSNDVKTSYFHVLASVKRLNMQLELWKSMHDRWLTVGEMINLGEANEADRQLANANQECQRLQVMEAENDLMYSWENLIAVLGVNIPYRKLAGDLEGEPQLMSWDSLVERLIKQSPQMGEAHEKLKSDEITLKREQRQKIPNVVLSGGAGYDQLDQGFAARANFEVVNIPLFDRNQGTVQQARADLNRQRAQVQLVEIQLRKKLAEKYREYVTAVQHVQAYKKTILPALRKRYELMLTSYKDTRTDWPTVLEAQHDFFKERLAYIQFLENWREHEVLLNGFLLTGALEAPEGITPPGHIDATPKPR